MQCRLRSANQLKALLVCDACFWTAESQGHPNFLFLVGYWCSMLSCLFLFLFGFFFPHRLECLCLFCLHLSWYVFPDWLCLLSNADTDCLKLFPKCSLYSPYVYIHSREQVMLVIREQVHMYSSNLVSVNLCIHERPIIRFLPFPSTLFWKYGWLILTDIQKDRKPLFLTMWKCLNLTNSQMFRGGMWCFWTSIG